MPAERGRVLVIDDEPLIGSSLRRALSGEHDVSAVTSAAEALRLLLGGERYDLVLCDLMMPEMTGMELHAELERQAPDVARAMVFATGDPSAPAVRSFLERVPNARLDKPFDLARLRALVRLGIVGR